MNTLNSIFQHKACILQMPYEALQEKNVSEIMNYRLNITFEKFNFMMKQYKYNGEKPFRVKRKRMRSGLPIWKYQHFI